MGTDPEKLIRLARKTLAPYGQDYALGAVHGLAVRNMVAVSLPDPSQGFYPIVRVHEMVLKDLEDLFYSHIQSDGIEADRAELIKMLVDREIWK